MALTATMADDDLSFSMMVPFQRDSRPDETACRPAHDEQRIDGRFVARTGERRLIRHFSAGSCRRPLETRISVATPGFSPSGHCQRTLPCGRWEAGREAEPLVLVIRGATSAPRRCSCLPTGSSALAASLGRGPDLRAHHPARIPFADRPGTVPSTLIRFMTRVPAREMRRIMREKESTWTDFFFFISNTVGPII